MGKSVAGQLDAGGLNDGGDLSWSQCPGTVNVRMGS